MTRAELITEVAKGHGETKARTELMLEAFLGSIQRVLVGGQEVTLHGFGKFKTVTRAARKGRNPKTGVEIDLPAKKSIKFSPQKALREAVA